MTQRVKSNHPKSRFCFYVSGRQLDEDVLSQMQTLLTNLAENRTWVIGPPMLADEHDGDVRMIGGTLDLYTALPPFGADLPKEVDRQHLEEVTAIVESLKLFSARTGLEVTFTLDQNYVGRIKNGEPDELIRIGLLGEWRKSHGIS